MFVKTKLSRLRGLKLASFDVVYVCPYRSELGVLIFRRRDAPPRRALFIDLPVNPQQGTVAGIRDQLDPKRLEDDWLP